MSASLVLNSLASAVSPLPVTAYHTETTSNEHLVVPSLLNGYRVYLSSPRHTDSGSRGECGWQENRNGRNWNMYAQGFVPGYGFASRRYRSIASPNAKDGGYVANVTRSDNWGADVHIVTHTNADNPCNDSTQYLLVMFSDASTSKSLRTQLIDKINPAVPGASNTWNCDDELYECRAPDAPWRSYLELFFHTSQDAVNWYQSGDYSIHGEAVTDAWLTAYAVDVVLGYPR